MSFNAIRENKTLAKISEFSVLNTFLFHNQSREYEHINTYEKMI